MKAVFRVDAASHIGSGHVMRCLTLAQSMRNQGFEILFICRLFQGHMLDKVRSSGFTALSLPSNSKDHFACNDQDQPPYKNWLGIDWQSDADETLSLIGSECDWLIVDHYALDSRWEQKLRAKARFILTIDDLADRSHNCDLLLDQNVAISGKSDYRELTPESTQRFLGTEYCLLRPEFHFNYSRPSSDKFSLLVFMGGADSKGLSLKILDTLKTAGHLNLTVLLQPTHPDYASIAHICSQSGHTCLPETHNMAELIAQHHAAIIACGFISYETAALNVPSLLLPHSDIQNQVADRLVELGTGVKLMPELLNSKSLKAAINKLKGIRLDDQTLFPSGGTAKVIAAMQQISTTTPSCSQSTVAESFISRKP
ncbi:MAG: UDP-2,4-diacetamido-2,4,6-trideoxy-beta-L-altropyranose hydrolase [Endozoicomonas sp.]|uniref:UDP-2,4-diacetamido-2,4, 6-trideoxy-beta-L-altropyranose hydrolase n=1 Tax=Endozoicomonas sp. TaxID=1892382 RepID=UPI003D9B0354